MTELQQRIMEDTQEARSELKLLSEQIARDVNSQIVGNTSFYWERLRHARGSLDRSLSAIRVEAGGKP